ncbi:MAG: protein-L-isoaspartate(D-aspartate) O-methyltransferase [Verrucomicrobiota bacterium]|nr:protein-L-isoaspartate(D-aspartate) O-methyltransferase [Verrucomicrobiota bacterium]
MLLAGCGRSSPTVLIHQPAAEEVPKAGVDSHQKTARKAERFEMVTRQIVARGVQDTNVLSAMRKVERHRFIPLGSQPAAYRDSPVPIGYEQTISQPFIVAYMTEALNPKSGDRVLEIGTGSGYQAAVLAEIVEEVYTIEIVEPLASQAQDMLKELKYKNIRFRTGDGYKGWPEAAPFDKIIVTAASPKVPQPLLDQLKPGGRMIIPVGRWNQELLLIRHTPDGYQREHVFPVRFVPMTGAIQEE